MLPKQYVVGWAKRGPSGLIGTNSPDSAATVEQMLADLRAGQVAPAAEPAVDGMPALLAARGVDAVTWADWQRLDKDEIGRGKLAGKMREKCTTVAEMMAAVLRLRS